MASHFSAIGLPVTDFDALTALVDRIAPAADALPARRHGQYLRWTDPSGAQMWIQVDRDNGIIGVQPHFQGPTRVPVAVTASIDRKEGLDGAFYGWASPPEGAVDEGDYPFVFDAPDHRLHPDVRMPGVVQVQIAAFAHDVQRFDSVEAYQAAQAGEPGYAVQSFIPTGTFDADQPAIAVLTGIIRRADCRTNRLTGLPFYWAEVETFGAHLDVVIDPESLDAPPTTGGVLQGEFWLSGRLLDYERRSQSWWQRLTQSVGAR